MANQRGIIELMEEQLGGLRELGRRQEKELQRWDETKPLLRRTFCRALTGKGIVLFSRCESEAEQIRGLLEESGAAVTHIFLASTGEEGAGETGELRCPLPDAAELSHLLSLPGGMSAAELEPLGLELRQGEGWELQGPAECRILLLFTGEGRQPCSFFNELWRLLHEKGMRVIALLPWQENRGKMGPPGMKGEPSLVDNIDTFWGEMALLLMLAEDGCGHYGFDSAARGLLPPALESR